MYSTAPQKDPPTLIRNRRAAAGMAVWKERMSQAGFVAGDTVMLNCPLISPAW